MATSSSKVIFSRDELDLIVEFAGCSLDESPGKNWVENGGGLPEYICRIARAIKRTGKTTSQAIAIAVSRVKKWAAGADDVDADTRAKAAKALAEWEKLKAKNKAKKTVKATATSDILCLANVSSFNVDMVRRAWNTQTADWRTKWRAQNPMAQYSDAPPYSYIRELWTDHLIVESETGNDDLYRVGYTVDDQNNVTFEEPVRVRTEYVVVEETDMFGIGTGGGTQPSNSELRQLMATAGPCHPSATEQVLMSLSSSASALDTVLATTVPRTAMEKFLRATNGKK